MRDGNFAADDDDFSLLVSGSQRKPCYSWQTDLPNHDGNSKVGEEIKLSLALF